MLVSSTPQGFLYHPPHPSHYSQCTRRLHMSSITFITRSFRAPLLSCIPRGTAPLVPFNCVWPTCHVVAGDKTKWKKINPTSFRYNIVYFIIMTLSSCQLALYPISWFMTRGNCGIVQFGAFCPKRHQAATCMFHTCHVHSYTM